jgi:hypothetical protein
MLRGPSMQLLGTCTPTSPSAVINAADEAREASSSGTRCSTATEAKSRGGVNRAQWLAWTNEVGWVRSCISCVSKGLGSCFSSHWGLARAAGGGSPGPMTAGAPTGYMGRLQQTPRFAIAFTVICALLFASQMVTGGVQWVPSSLLVGVLRLPPFPCPVMRSLRNNSIVITGRAFGVS